MLKFQTKERNPSMIYIVEIKPLSGFFPNLFPHCLGKGCIDADHLQISGESSQLKVEFINSRTGLEDRSL